MVRVEFGPLFEKALKRTKDASLRERLKRQIAKVVENPETGKPMRYARKGTREVHIPPFRLSYAYLKDENRIIFLGLYHKDKQ